MARTPLVSLRDREIELRPLRRTDRREFVALRARNAERLRRWDASDPSSERGAPTFGQMLRWMDDGLRRGTMLPLVIVADGRLAGQVLAGPVQYGAISSASIGYWVDLEMTGRGIAPRATALLIDHCFTALGLHRVQIDVRSDNAASLRVVEKLRLRDEGLRERLIHVDGQWRDHRSFALTAEEAPWRDGVSGVLRRLLDDGAHATRHDALPGRVEPVGGPPGH